MTVYTVEVTSPTTKQKMLIEVHATSTETAIARIRTATMKVLSWREEVAK